jgi:hypothetical protein
MFGYGGRRPAMATSMPTRRAEIVLTGFPVFSLGVPRYDRQGSYQELLPGYPFRSQSEYRKEIRQADGTETPKWGSVLPGSAVSVLKLEPGCGVTAILVKSPASGQGVHEVQSPPPPAVPELSTVTVAVRPSSPEALCRTLLVTSSLSRSTAVSPAGCCQPSTAAANARATATRPCRGDARSAPIQHAAGNDWKRPA